MADMSTGMFVREARLRDVQAPPGLTTGDFNRLFCIKPGNDYGHLLDPSEMAWGTQWAPTPMPKYVCEIDVDYSKHGVFEGCIWVPFESLLVADAPVPGSSMPLVSYQRKVAIHFQHHIAQSLDRARVLSHDIANIAVAYPASTVNVLAMVPLGRLLLNSESQAMLEGAFELLDLDKDGFVTAQDFTNQRGMVDAIWTKLAPADTNGVLVLISC